MPPLQGEVSLLTLFADVHYYFSPPTYKPLHHRFDRSSYVYLYHNPIQRSGRIEVANHAGTPEQDAFAGSLDTVKIEQSYKHPCLFTVTVDAFRSQNGSTGTSPQQDTSSWHLPAPDPSNNGKYMYKLHTIDIYFWTPDDASLFLDSLRIVAQPHQLHILENPQAVSAPTETKPDPVNPLVAKLEKAAFSHSSRSPSLSGAPSFPGPPTAPAPASSPPTADPNTNYAPMAYNPVAPAAPEPIAHREKTPPPPDAADGTGLNTIPTSQPYQATNPLQTAFTPQPTSSQPYMPGPPSRSSTFSGPPPLQHSPANSSIPPPPQSPPAHLQRSSTLPAPQYANYPPTPHSHTQSPLPSPSYASQAAPQYQPLASPSPGGYAQYQYSATGAPDPNNANANQNPYAMHQQLYRPTEQEATIKEHERPGGTPHSSNLGKRAEKVEKGVSRFLKKIDKKF